MPGLQSQVPITLAITGASGAVYGFTLLKFFLDNGYKIDLTLSDNSILVAREELNLNFRSKDLTIIKEQIFEYLEIEETDNLKLWDINDVAASISSGSYKTQGMIVAPCSMGTLANIAVGTSNNLIARAADVTLKERRRLVLIVRETPLSTIHLRNMLSLSEMGAVILPAAPGFYHHPQTITDQVNFILGKALDVFGFENELFKRWTKEQLLQLN